MTEVKRGIDHVVLSVRDLDAAEAFYRGAGFTLTPRAEQPFGTSNQMALLDGNFIDLLGTTAAQKIPPHQPGRYSLAAQHQEQLLRREGPSLLAMISDDARRDHEQFVTGGLQAGAPIDVTRPTRQPDGTDAAISFTMVVVPDARMGDAQHFIYEIRTPDTFWHSAYQAHANGAVEISEVVIVADKPVELVPFYAALVSPSAVQTDGDRLRVQMPKGNIVVLTPAELSRRFDGIEVTASERRPYVAGFQVRSRDLDLVEKCLKAGGIPYVRQKTAVRIAPAQAFGAAIEFVS
jgi:catechol 2,3-dioxygenase-like lactoylglutathione lyase family enzyme